MSPPPENPRIAAAFAWGGLAGAASYALQRLWSAWSGEVAYGDVIAQEHVPYSWRVALTVFHAVAIGLIVGLGLREGSAARSLAWVPLALVPVLALALAMGVVP